VQDGTPITSWISAFRSSGAIDRMEILSAKVAADGGIVLVQLMCFTLRDHSCRQASPVKRPWVTKIYISSTPVAPNFSHAEMSVPPVSSRSSMGMTL
jgi:hypothetical protein